MHFGQESCDSLTRPVLGPSGDSQAPFPQQDSLPLQNTSCWSNLSFEHISQRDCRRIAFLPTYEGLPSVDVSFSNQTETTLEHLCEAEEFRDQLLLTLVALGPTVLHLQRNTYVPNMSTLLKQRTTFELSHHGADVHFLCLLGQCLNHESTGVKLRCRDMLRSSIIRVVKAAAPKSKRKSLTVSGTACTRYTSPLISSSRARTLALKPVFIAAGELATSVDSDSG